MKWKLPPLFVFLFFVILLSLVSSYLPFGAFEFFGSIIVALVLSIVAVIFIVWSLYLFSKKKTAVHPYKLEKTVVLVTSGVYKITRNPMYLAMLLLLLALALVLGNAFNILVVAGFVSYMNRFQIAEEEKFLAQKFGKEYTSYLIKTRRWF